MRMQKSSPWPRAGNSRDFAAPMRLNSGPRFMDFFSIFRRMLPMAGVLLVLATAKAQQTSAPAMATIPGMEFHDGLEQETFSLINRYRRESSLLPLQWDNAIAKLARVHSRDMATGATDFGHDGFGDRVSRLK